MKYKQIPEYESRYHVYDDGRIRSTPTDGKKARWLKLENAGTKLIYRRASLSMNGVVKRFQVHRLVAEAFIPNPENKPFVNHIDNNTLNNNVLNLEWCTHSENMKHAHKQGRLDNSYESANKQRAQNQRIKICQKFSRLLGPRLIDIEYSRRTTITFKCKGCEQNYTARIDAPLFEYEKIRCRICKGK